MTGASKLFIAAAAALAIAAVNPVEAGHGGGGGGHGGGGGGHGGGGGWHGGGGG